MSTQSELLVEIFQALNPDLVVLRVLDKYVNWNLAAFLSNSILELNLRIVKINLSPSFYYQKPCY